MKKELAWSESSPRDYNIVHLHVIVVTVLLCGLVESARRSGADQWAITSQHTEYTSVSQCYASHHLPTELLVEKSGVCDLRSPHWPPAVSK